MASQFLFHFAQVHEEFRIPELLSVAELCGITLRIPEDDLKKLDVSRPFMILTLDSLEDAKKLARRCILIKCAFSLF